MSLNKTGIYIVTFSMIEPVNSQTGWGKKAMVRGINVTTMFCKVGKFENGENGRRKNYEKTYGSYFKMEILWSEDIDKASIRKLESLIKKELKEHRYINPKTNYRTEYVNLSNISLETVRFQVLKIIQEFVVDRTKKYAA